VNPFWHSLRRQNGKDKNSWKTEWYDDRLDEEQLLGYEHINKRAYDWEDWRHWRAAKPTWQGRAQEDLPGGVWRRIWTRQQNQRWKLIAFVVTMGLSCFLFEIWPRDRQQTDRRRINVFKHHISMAIRTNVSKHHISMAIKAGNRNSQVLQEGLGAHINFHNVCVVYTL